MWETTKHNAAILGLFICIGLSALGWLLGNAALKFKAFERTVTAKGLSEHEYPADMVIWPIQFNVAGNDLTALYNALESNALAIKDFLIKNDIPSDEITFSSPAITDKSALNYGTASSPDFRYSAFQAVTVYSKNVEKVRKLMSSLSELGKKGIAFTGNNYEAQTEYLFTRLNEVKPQMIEEATRKAREAAQKFAADSNSRLGKIKTASQGQFSIKSRDKNNPHIKKVRVVCTVVYYLSD